MKVKSQFWLLGSCLLLSGCVGLSADRYLANKRTYMLDQGNPPSYVIGYSDGCSSGRRLGGDKRFVYRKNNTQFDKDALYARGWQEAQINCRNEALVDKNAGLIPGNKKKKNEVDPLQPQKSDPANAAAEAEMREIWEELKK